MLRLRVPAYPDAHLQVNRFPDDAQRVCLREQLSTQRLENTNKHELRFRALLTESGAEGLELVKV